MLDKIRTLRAGGGTSRVISELNRRYSLPQAPRYFQNIYVEFRKEQPGDEVS